MKVILGICALLAGCALLLAGLTSTHTVFLADGGSAIASLLDMGADTDRPARIEGACRGSCTATPGSRPVAQTLPSGTSLTNALRTPATDDVKVYGD